LSTSPKTSKILYIQILLCIFWLNIIGVKKWKKN
jgi:hypothetical protein